MTPEKDRICQEIYEEHSRSLYTYIYRKTGDRSGTEDILQEIFIVFLFYLNGFIPDYPGNSKQVKSWLFKTADNKLLHYWRRMRKILTTEISTELLPELMDRYTSPEDAMLSLPDWLTAEDRQLLFLRSSGYSLQEAANRMGITYGACRMRASRLGRDLKKFYGK